MQTRLCTCKGPSHTFRPLMVVETLIMDNVSKRCFFGSGFDIAKKFHFGCIPIRYLPTSSHNFKGLGRVHYFVMSSSPSKSKANYTIWISACRLHSKLIWPLLWLLYVGLDLNVLDSWEQPAVRATVSRHLSAPKYQRQCIHSSPIAPLSCGSAWIKALFSGKCCTLQRQIPNISSWMLLSQIA